MTPKERILKVYDQADQIDKQEGMLAYERYHATMRIIADFYKFGFCQTVAAFVSLSPNNNWKGNLMSTISLIEGIQAGTNLEEIRTTSYKHCRDRAYQYALGNKDFLMETKGPKIRAFYHNIINPGCKKHITVDGHMFNLWLGTKMTMKDIAMLRPQPKYRDAEKDFKMAARRLGIIPCQLQAVLWFTWKRINKIVYSPQLGLFNQGDQWKTQIDISQLEKGELYFS